MNDIILKEQTELSILKRSIRNTVLFYTNCQHKSVKTLMSVLFSSAAQQQFRFHSLQNLHYFRFLKVNDKRAVGRLMSVIEKGYTVSFIVHRFCALSEIHGCKATTYNKSRRIAEFFPKTFSAFYQLLLES